MLGIRKFTRTTYLVIKVLYLRVEEFFLAKTRCSQQVILSDGSDVGHYIKGPSVLDRNPTTAFFMISLWRRAAKTKTLTTRSCWDECPPCSTHADLWRPWNVKYFNVHTKSLFALERDHWSIFGHFDIANWNESLNTSSSAKVVNELLKKQW